MRVLPIPFAPGYFIREDGVVYSTRLSRGRRRAKLRAAIWKDGYARQTLMIHARPKTFMTHAIVARVFVGPKPSVRHGVRHLDGNSLNNHFKNLAWGTQQENIDDRTRHGTTAYGRRNGAHTHPEKVRRGEDSTSARLTAKDVAVIRRRLAGGEFGICLAREFGVAKTTISAIKNGHTWSRT